MARISNAADRPKRGCATREQLVQRCLNVTHILIAIFVIGIVGMLLEALLVGIAKRFSWADT